MHIDMHVNKHYMYGIQFLKKCIIQGISSSLKREIPSKKRSIILLERMV